MAPPTAPAYQGTLCPFLTVADVIARGKPEPSRVVLAGMQQPPTIPEKEAVACQGPSCQWFQKLGPGPDGVDRGEGCCSVVIIAKLLNTHCALEGALVERLGSVFGAGTNKEAQPH